ncbi:hypothetical protein CSAL01_11795 [Colletotrichum salicis]|uniref:Uncharacterized protein n=1 Tax=Colletotrichum salicis TaxID=1209931 RepID=A0A135U3T2_9PEZI|nr:hypothetical protein CSAL01_11795 [Colletotrichum salicis]
MTHQLLHRTSNWCTCHACQMPITLKGEDDARARPGTSTTPSTPSPPPPPTDHHPGPLGQAYAGTRIDAYGYRPSGAPCRWLRQRRTTNRAATTRVGIPHAMQMRVGTAHPRDRYPASATRSGQADQQPPAPPIITQPMPLLLAANQRQLPCRQKHCVQSRPAWRGVPVTQIQS